MSAASATSSRARPARASRRRRAQPDLAGVRRRRSPSCSRRPARPRSARRWRCRGRARAGRRARDRSARRPRAGESAGDAREALADGAAQRLGIHAGAPHDGRGGRDREHVRAGTSMTRRRMSGSLSDQELLGDRERHEHEAVGSGERRLEDAADDVKSRLRIVSFEPIVAAEVARDLRSRSRPRARSGRGCGGRAAMRGGGIGGSARGQSGRRRRRAARA